MRRAGSSPAMRTIFLLANLCGLFPVGSRRELLSSVKPRQDQSPNYWPIDSNNRVHPGPTKNRRWSSFGATELILLWRDKRFAAKGSGAFPDRIRL